MTRESKILLWIMVALGVASFFLVRHLKGRMITLNGAVITQDQDPRKQLPIAGVEVTASDGESLAKATSDSSGLFSIKLRNRILRSRAVIFQFRHPEFQPLDLKVLVSNRIYLAAMTPLPRKQPAEDGPQQTIANAIVRYSIKTATEVTIGSSVRAFEAVNTGNVPCTAHLQCSPDGKWKASTANASLDAGEGNEFRNARASCIAGPCPFTKIDRSTLTKPGRMVRVSAMAWSDTATFLLEAEVVRPTISDVVRNSYPTIFGDTLNFTLPPAAEGLSIEADLNGEAVVFPLGPSLIVSWADCNARTNPDQTRVYRCELKPGYRWRNPGTSVGG